MQTFLFWYDYPWKIQSRKQQLDSRADQLWYSWHWLDPGNSLFGRGGPCHVHCRMCGSITGHYLLVASPSPALMMTTKIISRLTNAAGAQNCPHPLKAPAERVSLPGLAFLGRFPKSPPPHTWSSSSLGFFLGPLWRCAVSSNTV